MQVKEKIEKKEYTGFPGVDKDEKNLEDDFDYLTNVLHYHPNLFENNQA